VSPRPSVIARDVEPTEPTRTVHQNVVPNRSTEMQLMHEDLARAHAAQRLEEAVSRSRQYRLVAAHRAHRRAEQAALRARRLLASAVIG
jgi:hypothetical protein